jgi:FtsZ-binding cell division protein ZapB
MNKSLSVAVAQLESEIDSLREQTSRYEYQIDNANKTLSDLETENNHLRQETKELVALLGKINKIESNGPAPDGMQITVGISDLEKRNEEAVFDALTAFDKKCPYCSKEQFRVGIRDKIEIDHFVPISKGGQNLPWNLVPTCKNCNRKKKDRLPFDFLNRQTFEMVNTYLATVQKKFQDEGIESYLSAITLSRLLEKHKEFLIQNSWHEFVKELVHLTNVDKSEYLLENNKDSYGGVNKDYISNQIKSRLGAFEKGIVGSPFHLICERISEEGNFHLEAGILFQLLKQAGWKDCGLIASREFPSKKHLYCAPELKGMSKSELRRRLEN